MIYDLGDQYDINNSPLYISMLQSQDASPFLSTINYNP